MADLPNEVVKPYVCMVYNQFKITRRDPGGAKWPGITEMANVVGLSSKAIQNILSDSKHSVTIETCDKIAMHGDFSINEIFEDTLEWAKKNPDKNWPEDYLGGRPRKRT